MSYRLTERLQFGIEWNPLADSFSPLANWHVLEETEERPAVILGTSSDRIGTPHGQSFYATASKDLEKEIGLPVAPYAGVAYGTFEDEWRPIGGGRIRYSEVFSSTHLYDGRHGHHILNATIGGRHTLGLLWIGHEHVGVSYSVAFDF